MGLLDLRPLPYTLRDGDPFYRPVSLVQRKSTFLVAWGAFGSLMEDLHYLFRFFWLYMQTVLLSVEGDASIERQNCFGLRSPFGAFGRSSNRQSFILDLPPMGIIDPLASFFLASRY